MSPSLGAGATAVRETSASPRAARAIRPSGRRASMHRTTDVRRRELREDLSRMAEREGFEPSDPRRGQPFSRPPDSATLAPLRGRFYRNLRGFRKSLGPLLATEWLQIRSLIQSEAASEDVRP